MRTSSITFLIAGTVYGAISFAATGALVLSPSRRLAQTAPTNLPRYAYDEDDEEEAEERAEDAKWDKLEAAATGDRTAYVRLWRYGGGRVYGPGRTPVTTPDQFRNSRALYFCSVKERGGVPIWTITGTRFKGDKRTGPDFKDSGVGSDCPSSAFK